MATATQSVLVVGVSDALFARLEPLLQRASFNVDRVHHARNAVPLFTSIGFGVLLFAYPTEQPSFRELMEMIRSDASPCRTAAVLILAPSEQVEKARQLTNPARTKVMPIDASDAELHAELAALLRSAPRLSARVVIRLEVELADGRTEILTQTENVSMGGMLVRAPRSYPVGANLRFQLYLSPASPSVWGTGVVARHALDEHGRLIGVGVSFQDFTGDGETQLREYLGRQ